MNRIKIDLKLVRGLDYGGLWKRYNDNWTSVGPITALYAKSTSNSIKIVNLDNIPNI